MTAGEREGVGDECELTCWTLFEGLRLGFGWRYSLIEIERQQHTLTGRCASAFLYMCVCVCVVPGR